MQFARFVKRLKIEIYTTMKNIQKAFLVTCLMSVGLPAYSIAPIHSDVKLEPINIVQIASEQPLELTFTYTPAIVLDESSIEEVTYSICEKNVNFEHNCKTLASSINPVLEPDSGHLKQSFPVDSLISILDKEYFVLAKLGEQKALSNERVLDAETASEFVTYFKGSRNTTMDHFGRTVSMNKTGDLLAVSAPEHTTGTNGSYKEMGLVYIYYKQDNLWKEMKVIEGNALASNSRAYFGTSLSFADDKGEWLAIGSSTAYSDTSRIDLYRINTEAKTISTKPVTIKEPGVISFGYAIEVTSSENPGGAYMIVGSPRHNNDRGQVDVYQIKSNYVEHLQTFNSPDAYEGQYFGEDVAVDRTANRFVVGSPRKELNGQSNVGAAYVYESIVGESAWRLTDTLLPSALYSEEQHFGESVDIADNGVHIAVGSPGDDDVVTAEGRRAPERLCEENTGAVYLYNLNHNGFKEMQYLKAPYEIETREFGSFVKFALNGGLLAVGSQQDGIDGKGVLLDENYLIQGKGGNSVYLYEWEKYGSPYSHKAVIKPFLPPSDFGNSFPGFGDAIFLSEDGVLAVGAQEESCDFNGILLSPDPDSDQFECYGYDSRDKSGAVLVF
ncbi:hypothetical protein F0224_23000 [Vibrio coralliilyticus]|uniref:hypothetical protein n=1 Tax=Vibrio coralliilyticus TaxID=190893 RepID=UPI000BAC14AD|nr:hypothetical protein [Vibrio coralliilyticus]NOI78527.1 hypothetical protein [Vibrio coralliilyticus]PAW00868.1 hypothetical protein CKJ79_24480 [Vibrio coralliilyticus]